MTRKDPPPHSSSYTIYTVLLKRVMGPKPTELPYRVFFSYFYLFLDLKFVELRAKIDEALCY